jgi:hypothetical protein
MPLELGGSAFCEVMYKPCLVCVGMQNSAGRCRFIVMLRYGVADKCRKYNALRHNKFQVTKSQQALEM